MTDKKPWYATPIGTRLLWLGITTIPPGLATLLTAYAVPSLKNLMHLDNWVHFALIELLLLLLLVLALFVLNRIKNKQIKSLTENKLTLKYGIYWDKNKQPLCPKCKPAEPLTYVNRYTSSDQIRIRELHKLGDKFIESKIKKIKWKKYRCHACKNRFTLRDENGKYITAKYAMKNL